MTLMKTLAYFPTSKQHFFGSYKALHSKLGMCGELPKLGSQGPTPFGEKKKK